MARRETVVTVILFLLRARAAHFELPPGLRGGGWHVSALETCPPFSVRVQRRALRSTVPLQCVFFISSHEQACPHGDIRKLSYVRARTKFQEHTRCRTHLRLREFVVLRV